MPSGQFDGLDTEPLTCGPPLPIRGRCAIVGANDVRRRNGWPSCQRTRFFHRAFRIEVETSRKRPIDTFGRAVVIQEFQGNIVIHDSKRQRYRCKVCKRTFSARRGTMFEGLRKPVDLIVIVVTLLTYGCPVQAIVHAFGLDERTVAAWRDRAGVHCQHVHQAMVEQGQLDLMHVQADEIRVKGCKMIAWMGLAMMVSTRLWLGGVVQLSRDRTLADRLMSQVRRSALLIIIGLS